MMYDSTIEYFSGKRPDTFTGTSEPMPLPSQYNVTITANTDVICDKCGSVQMETLLTNPGKTKIRTRIGHLDMHEEING